MISTHKGDGGRVHGKVKGWAEMVAKSLKFNQPDTEPRTLCIVGSSILSSLHR